MSRETSEIRTLTWSSRDIFCFILLLSRYYTEAQLGLRLIISILIEVIAIQVLGLNPFVKLNGVYDT